MDEDLKEVVEFENVLKKIKLLNYEIVKYKLLLAHFYKFLTNIGFFLWKNCFDIEFVGLRKIITKL